MTNAKISAKACTIFKNKGLSAAIARELATNARAVAKDGSCVEIGGKKVRIQIASSARRNKAAF